MWKVTCMLFFYKYVPVIILAGLLITFVKWGYPYLTKEWEQKKPRQKIRSLFFALVFCLILSNVILLSKPQAFVSTAKKVEALEREHQALKIKKDKENDAKEIIDRLYSNATSLFATQKDKKILIREKLDLANSKLADIPSDELENYQEKIRKVTEQVKKQEALNISEAVQTVYTDTYGFGWDETLEEAENRKNAVTRERYTELVSDVRTMTEGTSKNKAFRTLELIDRWLNEQGL